MKNEQTSVRGIPAWLDGRTVALIGTVCTVGLGVAATSLASVSALRSDMNARFNGVNERIVGVEASVNARIDGVNDRIDGLDSRLRAVEVGIAEIRGRLRAVEVGIAEIRGHLGFYGPHSAEDATPQHP